MKERNRLPISVIIPVYNVSEWLDACMTSVMNQTFTDFEVILINDGSTDGSDIICREWAEKDNRIKFISKENEGVSKTRNYGIGKASGEYLVFIDSDDWICASYLEKMYKAIHDNNVMMSECDIYKYDNITGEITHHVASGRMGVPYTVEEHIKYGIGAIWNCMIKKSLFIDNKITFPDCHSEAKAVYALLIAICGKVANVCEGLYYYRKFRTGSLSERPRANQENGNDIGLQTYDYLLNGFKRCGLYEKYERVLREYIQLRLSKLLAGQFYRRDKRKFFQLEERCSSYIRQNLDGVTEHKYITLGGYNLNRILWHLNQLHNPYNRFNFSSLISIMHPLKEKLNCSQKNKYREIMVNRDINSLFWNIIEEIKPEYIFMDFIEERFDILEYSGGYITKSDAYDDAQLSLNGAHIIERNSEKCLELWIESFQSFEKCLREHFPNVQLVIIENYLSEEVGDVKEKHYFDDVAFIRNINRTLKDYYDFVSDRYSDILMIEATKCRYYYTDKNYEYGAIPSHLNEIVNREIAKLIEEKVDL